MCVVAANHMLFALQIPLPDIRIHEACGIHMRQSMRRSSLKGQENHFRKPEKTSQSLSRSFPDTLESDLALENYLDDQKHQLFPAGR